MPEGDTVWRVAERLNRAFAREPLTAADLRWPGLSTTDLVGRETREVVSRGKHILHRLDGNLTVHSHLRMEGMWQLVETSRATAGRLRRDEVRAVLATATWTAIGERLGMLDIVATDRERELVGHLGPDLLGADWDTDLAAANLVRSRQTIGAAMLDQRNLAGVGTLWASELLFLHRVPPWTAAQDVDPAVLAAMLTALNRLIGAARAHAVQSTTGSRRPGDNTYVHGRSGRACRRCGTTVRVAMIGPPLRERAMFYCPGCQDGIGPTDDALAQRPLGSGSRRNPR